MKNDQSLRNDIRIVLDRRLSDVTERPDSQQRMLRLIEEKEQPVKKKISVGFVIVLALLVAIMTAALATGGFGLLDFKQEQTNNQTFIEHIVPVGQTFENDYLSITVNEALFNGSTLSFTMDMAAKDDSNPVYVIPTITADIGGKALTAIPTSASGNYCDTGFWLPEMDPRIEPQTQFGVEASLIGLLGDDFDYSLPTGDVTWHLSFEILHPNYPISYVEATLPSDDSDGVLTDEMDERYNHLFAEAYANRRILLNPDGSLLNYIVQMPQPDGISGGEKSWEELKQVLKQSDAFTIVDCPIITFTTSGGMGQNAEAGQIFPLVDGWQAELIGLRTTFDRVDCSLRLTRSAPDGLTAAQMLEKGEYWTFAVLAEGSVTTPFGASWGMNEDGSYHWQATVALSSPTTRITFVPCRATETWQGTPAPDGWVPTYDTERMVYDAQAPYTDEQKEISFSVTN